MSLIDSLSEQFFGGWFKMTDRNQFKWESSSIKIRINDTHKAAHFLFVSNRNMTLSMVRKSLIDASDKFGANSNIGRLAGLLFKKFEHVTAKWQHEAIEYLRKQVNLLTRNF